MHAFPLLLLLLLRVTSTTAAAAHDDDAERVLAAYVFHRHGDRTAKAWKPVNLTALGAAQAHASGAFYRARYVAAGAAARLAALSPDAAVPAQLAVSAPRDAVLHGSAVAFLQGLYPPVAGPRAADALANGSVVASPLGGYQYVPVDAVSDADKAEDRAWLQGASGCARAEVSSNAYFASPEYRAVYDDSRAFYHGLLPIVGAAYSSDTTANFKNGYTIFDLVNVATIHNSSSLVSPATLARLRHLASVHEWNLAYNASEPVRAIAGFVLAAHVLAALQAVVDARASAPTLVVQFGAYATFMSFFGLAQLPSASPDFFGICDYASSMVFELVTTAQDPRPRADDISVRFLFANGSAADAGLRPFPLFGQDSVTLKWADFKAAMAKFAIADTKHWCDLCGSTEGKCASFSSDSASASASPQNPSRPADGVSKPVAGVIGALVTLVVVLGVQAAIMLLGGLRLVSIAGARRGSDGGNLGGAKL